MEFLEDLRIKKKKIILDIYETKRATNAGLLSKLPLFQISLFRIKGTFTSVSTHANLFLTTRILVDVLLRTRSVGVNK